MGSRWMAKLSTLSSRHETSVEAMQENITNDKLCSRALYPAQGQVARDQLPGWRDVAGPDISSDIHTSQRSKKSS